ncbi:hypothetical protein [Streptacidiphilus sp. EB129]|uniref:hypothetical protein n=1 Tax=Streptacidiphilus sp. EB129 TaxID=3156262 RepID=UPI0035134F95
MTTSQPVPPTTATQPALALTRAWQDAIRAGATTRQAAMAALQTHDNATRPKTPETPHHRNIELLQVTSLTELISDALTALATDTNSPRCVETADWLWVSGAITTTPEHDQAVTIALAIMLLAEGAGLEHDNVLPPSSRTS